MSKPRIISPCVAERYSNDRTSRIAEFSTKNGGGLIEIRNGETGPVVSIYRCDKSVTVVSSSLTEREKRLIQSLEACVSCLTSGRDDREHREARALLREIERSVACG